MYEIPLNADVQCTDGHAGKSTHIIIDPRQRTVTHIVVKTDKSFSGQDWLIPIEQIIETTHDLIRLNFPVADMEKFPPFSATRYVDYGEDYANYIPDALAVDGSYTFPTVSQTYVPLVDEAIPQGEWALEQGAMVEATDGLVGEVGELIVDADSNQITHFSLEEGHFFGKHEVVLPLSAVHRIEEYVVYLKLDKKAIHSLPAVPRKGGKATTFEFIARLFDAPNKAADALAFVKELQTQQRGALKIHNSALLVKDAEGKLTVTETGNLSPKKGTILGGVAGGLLGALAGPVGIVIGAAAGAGLGRASTHWFDHGLPDAFVKRLEEYLKPNTSALILLIDTSNSASIAEFEGKVEHSYLELLSESMAGMGGVVMQYTLTDAVVEQLLKEQEGHAPH